MAGTIPLSMTQQFNALGKPLTGGKLYLFQAATTTPQSAYSDTGLTAALPNPVTLDSSGRIPQFFLADGAIKVRLTDKSGVIQSEWDNVLVIGPSGSGAGAGATVDPTTVFQTGFVIWLDQSGVLSGFVRDNGRTIGSATSGASERANSDTSALFSFLWNNFSDARCPVSTGRGASAAADFAANKTIQLPDKRGRTPVGLDDMGNSAAGRLSGAVFSGADTATTVGGLGGEPTHTSLVNELPIFTPSGTVNTGTTVNIVNGSNVWEGLGGGIAYAGGGLSTNTPSTFAAISATATSASTFVGNAVGGGVAHNNMQPFVLGTYYRKL